MHLFSLARAPESQLIAEQSLTGRHQNSPKRYHTFKDKGEAAMRQTSTELGETETALLEGTHKVVCA